MEPGHEVARENVARILRKAAELDAFVRIDMEDHTKTDETLELWREVRPTHPATGVVLQSALRRTEADVDAIVIPWGGGGLCCGIASAVRALNPGCRILAAEVATAAPLAAMPMQ